MVPSISSLQSSTRFLGARLGLPGTPIASSPTEITRENVDADGQVHMISMMCPKINHECPPHDSVLPLDLPQLGLLRLIDPRLIRLCHGVNHAGESTDTDGGDASKIDGVTEEQETTGSNR